MMVSSMLPMVGELALVERLEDTGLDLAREEGPAGHDHVVAGAAGEQLGLEDVVGIEDVVDDLDAGLGLEFGEDLLVDIVGPGCRR